MKEDERCIPNVIGYYFVIGNRQKCPPTSSVEVRMCGALSPIWR